MVCEIKGIVKIGDTPVQGATLRCYNQTYLRYLGNFITNANGEYAIPTPQWNTRIIVADSTNGWYGGGMNKTGQYQLVGYNSGRLYLSSDYGVTFTEIRPDGNNNRDWNGIWGISDSGQYMLVGSASSTTGKTHISSDYGVTWTTIYPHGSVTAYAYAHTAVSKTGRVMLCGRQQTGRAFISTNYGVTWTEIRPEGDVNRSYNGGFVISDDETKILVATSLTTEGRVYMSDDDGITFTNLFTAGLRNWSTISASGDFTKIIIGAQGSRAYLSINSGSSWTELQLYGNINKTWLASAVSFDGTKMMLGDYPGRVFFSSDSGTNWVEIYPSGIATNYNWIVLRLNTDASKRLAVAYNGRVYSFDSDLKYHVSVEYENGGTKYNAKSLWDIAPFGCD